MKGMNRISSSFLSLPLCLLIGLFTNCWVGHPISSQWGPAAEDSTSEDSQTSDLESLLTLVVAQSPANLSYDFPSITNQCGSDVLVNATAIYTGVIVHCEVSPPFPDVSGIGCSSYVTLDPTCNIQAFASSSCGFDGEGSGVYTVTGSGIIGSTSTTFTINEVGC